MFLLLNADKPEVDMLDPKHIKNSLSNNIVNLDDITLATSTTVRILNDQESTIKSNVKQISRMPFFHLCSIAKF